MSGRAEGTQSSVFDVVSVQWIISKVVYVAAEWPALHVGVAALVSQLVCHLTRIEVGIALGCYVVKCMFQIKIIRLRGV